MAGLVSVPVVQQQLGRMTMPEYRCPECNSENVEACILVNVNWNLQRDEPAENHPIIERGPITSQSKCDAWCLDCEWRGTVDELRWLHG